mmetsp:Transcript_23894/g.76855  ORF Transcript_23894/g.76855 Transcript_23894/m.76855 type:complete len:209 (+) Transcript_23894:1349-1975(+)
MRRALFGVEGQPRRHLEGMNERERRSYFFPFSKEGLGGGAEGGGGCVAGGDERGPAVFEAEGIVGGRVEGDVLVRVGVVRLLADLEGEDGHEDREERQEGRDDDAKGRLAAAGEPAVILRWVRVFVVEDVLVRQLPEHGGQGVVVVEVDVVVVVVFVVDEGRPGESVRVVGAVRLCVFFASGKSKLALLLPNQKQDKKEGLPSFLPSR